MTRPGCLAWIVALVMLPSVPVAGAQHVAPIAMKATEFSQSTMRESPSTQPIRVQLAADTARRQPAKTPFLLGGLVVGGFVGGLLASSYSFCGEPQPGVTCTSTDTATGVVIGAGIGLIAGFLAWAIAAGYSAPDR